MYFKNGRRLSSLLPIPFNTSTLAILCTLGLLAGGCSRDESPAETTVETAIVEQQAMSEPVNYEADDVMFSEPYIDMDEWREEPVRHRYVHGGFKNTDTRFSLYLPPADQYEGRFFQYITPVPDSENLSQGATGEEDKIGFAIDSGAYFVESNGGGKFGAAMPGTDIDPTVGAYRANAAVAQYSRIVAMNMYGSQRPYGYAFGGSGGGFRTLAGMENTNGVWDGAVPFVIGSPMAIPNVFTVRTYAMRVLNKKLPDVADAVDAGSNKDPFTDIGLNDEESAALTEATKMGFPLRGWHAWDHLGLHAFALLFPSVVAADPSYFEDFWSKPGYEGYNPPESLQNALINQKTTIEKLMTVDEARAMGLQVGHLAGRPHGLADDAWKAMQGEHGSQVPVGIQLADVPEKNTLGTDLKVVSGKAAGSPLPIARIEQNIVLFTPGSEETVAKLKPGDEVLLDNRNFLAVQTYHRHQVPGRDFRVWDQFRDSEGIPIYPQRPMILGPIFAMGATGTNQTGIFSGKMIIVENLYDTEAFAWQADWYRNKARENLGDELDNNLRLWLTDHANHSDSRDQKDPTHTISYLGVLQQALRDLSVWVEKGVEPPANTSYKFVDGQLAVPATAAERHGIQPVVVLKANGAERADIKPGETVELFAEIEVPPGTGEVVSAEWDLDGKGAFPVPGDVTRNASGNATVKLTHLYDQPGTYFATLRVASQRQGDAFTPFTRIQNLARARVVVK